ncbi:NAD-dependent glyceraldehyde-3-phosphate dehydrogenase [Liberibacter crescens BT-1]|uniref:Glyceraldehyde-3-phosphate dehydrogenase n=1 Tax=Liberibacter crescens (strain BT-1) TaxID=1215343 RepID=L0EWI2_LIBCB|nr:type I glyceraldehyde-3-phosphate dehydrogenase [Liberibacter crescens]AGA65210.1 NAD-dependent glyceraldehyde-3-phosphate dehydrogenase [Liberibacter crescens BT-1]AMC13161.1 glyceraldehyde-3-phosphate dehydrogenase [Liberibacter crescens]
MAVKVAINGFGRIGRAILRTFVESGNKDIEIVAINDLGSIEANGHLIRYDSVHGTFQRKVKVSGDVIDVGFGPIKVTAIRDPKQLPWDGIDVVMECTGAFASREKALAHLSNGSKRVLVSAPCGGADKTIVYGINHNVLTKDDIVISNASCTTNCLAPVVYTLNKEFGIKKGYMTTVHSYTSDQPVLDSSHRDLYRSRSAALSMIPTSTGAAQAIGLVLPELKGKLAGSAIRVPTPNVSVIDLKILLVKKVKEEEINEVIKIASEGQLKNILSYVTEPLVSVDFNHDPHSSIFVADQTKVVDEDLVRVMAWYDNEWGFSNRMLDTAAAIGKFLKDI